MGEVLRYAAFTDGGRGGNPAGVVLDAGGMTDEEMLVVAAEVGFSETAFVVGPAPDGWRVRYFSPQAEVDFCGHATIATAVALAERDGPGEVTMLTAAGPVAVTSRATEDGLAATLVSVPPRTTPVDPSVLDSRARDGEPIPDPQLHEASIADALSSGRPSLILFSTPVYCVSRFCGPITDIVDELAATYADRATFVHVEVWSDFEEREVNPAASAWIATADGRMLEPWLFLVDGDGTITHSWDNIAPRDEVEAALDALPAP